MEPHPLADGDSIYEKPLCPPPSLHLPPPAYSGRLTDLAVSSGNRLELFKGNLAGSHSIRINGQWRIVFRWTDAGPAGVASWINIDPLP